MKDIPNTQNLFRPYFLNPKKKFIESNIICPECDAITDPVWKIGDKAVVSDNGKEETKLLDLDDVESPIDEAKVSEKNIAPKGSIIIDGIDNDEQKPEQFFSLEPEFASNVNLDGIPYNTDIRFNLKVPSEDSPTTLDFMADKNGRFPILDQINEFFKCMDYPIKVEIIGVEDTENQCSGTSLSEYEKCMDYILNKKNNAMGTKVTKTMYLKFSSDMDGYPFKVSDIVISKHFASKDFPLSPYVYDDEIKERVKIDENFVYGTQKITDETLQVNYLPKYYVVTWDEFGEPIKTKSTSTLEIKKPNTQEVKLKENLCLRKDEYKFEESKSVSYSIKVEYPNQIELSKKYIWLRHKPSDSILKTKFNSFNEERKKIGEEVYTYDKWFSEWKNQTIEEEDWVPVGSLYIVLGSTEKLLNSVIIKNPHSFHIKVKIAQHK